MLATSHDVYVYCQGREAARDGRSHQDCAYMGKDKSLYDAGFMDGHASMLRVEIDRALANLWKKERN